MQKQAWAGIWAAFAVLVGMGAAPATSPDAAAILAALRAGDAPAAVKRADAALKKPNIPPQERSQLWLLHGMAEERNGAMDAAIADFQSALKGDFLSPPDRARTLIERATLLDRSGRWDEAIADYSQVIRARGLGLSTALNNRANIYRRQYQFDQAKRDYEATLKTGANQPYAWFGLGLIAEAEGDSGKARAFYEKAVEANPGYDLARQRLAALGGSAGAPSGVLPSVSRSVIQNAGEPAPQKIAKVMAPKAATEPAVALRPGGSGSAEVQLGAWHEESEAKAGWEKARGHAPEVLAALQPRFLVADLEGRGRYYRLRIAVPAGENAAGFCGRLTAKGVACLPAPK
jgi:tetratricopeptide (TPR) repeat protein